MACQIPRARLLGYAVAAIILIATFTTAGGESDNSTRCALLDLNQSPVAALVEAKYRDVYRKRVWDWRTGEEIECRTALHPVTLFQVNLADKTSVTSYFTVGQRWRFQPIATP